MTPIAPPSLPLPVEAAGLDAAASPSALADKFGALMERLRDMPAHGPDGAVSAISGVAEAGNAALQALQDKMGHITTNSGTMSKEALHAASLQLVMDTAMVQFQLNAGMGLVQSSKSAVQTLFRNQ